MVANASRDDFFLSFESIVIAVLKSGKRLFVFFYGFDDGGLISCWDFLLGIFYIGGFYCSKSSSKEKESDLLRFCFYSVLPNLSCISR